MDGSRTAASLVLAQWRLRPRRAPAGRSGCGCVWRKWRVRADSQSYGASGANAGAEEAGASKAQRLLMRGPGRPQIGIAENRVCTINRSACVSCRLLISHTIIFCSCLQRRGRQERDDLRRPLEPPQLGNAQRPSLDARR